MQMSQIGYVLLYHAKGIQLGVTGTSVRPTHM